MPWGSSTKRLASGWLATMLKLAFTCDRGEGAEFHREVGGVKAARGGGRI